VRRIFTVSAPGTYPWPYGAKGVTVTDTNYPSCPHWAQRGQWQPPKPSCYPKWRGNSPSHRKRPELVQGNYEYDLLNAIGTGVYGGTHQASNVFNGWHRQTITPSSTILLGSGCDAQVPVFLGNTDPTGSLYLYQRDVILLTGVPTVPHTGHPGCHQRLTPPYTFTIDAVPIPPTTQEQQPVLGPGSRYNGHDGYLR